MADPFASAVHVLIEGRVQGVGYRAWTQAQAQARGLSGWVRNRAGGAVEAIFAGPEGEVAAMLAACHQGPRQAQVSRILHRVAEAAETADVVPGRFEVRGTA